MTSVAASNRAGSVGESTMTVITERVPGEPSLLPEPVEPECVAMSLELLLALVQKAEAKSVGAMQGQAAVDQKEREKKLQESLKKIDEEAKARNSPGFFKAVFRVIKDFAADLVTDPKRLFSDLGRNLDEMVTSPNFWRDLKAGCMAALKVVALVAAAAATVFTCGSASPLLVGAVLVLSAASMVDSQFHVLEKMGVDPKIAAVVDIAMGLAAAVLTFGAAASSSVSQLSRAAQTVNEATTGVTVGGNVVGGVATGVDAGFEKARLDRAADRKEIDGAMEELTELIKDLIARIKVQHDNLGSHQEAIEAAAAADGGAMQVLMSGGVRA